MSSQYFKQGIYKPVHKEKYIGYGNPTYRSSFELKFFQWCDRNQNVLKWGSENVVVPYISPVDGKPHRYFVDNVVHIREGTGITKYLIEIKPSKQTVAPTVSKRKKKSTIIYEQVTYAINTAKWEAAQEYAKKHGMKFLILTEAELFA